MSNDDDDCMIGDDDDEVLVGDDGDDTPNFIGSSTNSDEIPKQPLVSLNSILKPQVELISNILPSFNLYYNSNSIITFQIPTDVLPPSLKMVCGFYSSPILIDVKLTFQYPNWNKPLSSFIASHPIYNQNYIGRPLVIQTIRHFFSDSYKPKNFYRSKERIINSEEHFTFDTSPLLFLILELVDSFIDITDHCCICHSPLPFSVIKPSICDKKLCEVGFNEIGVGTSVAQEIRRDPKAADLLLSIFACSTCDHRYMEPKPPQELTRNLTSLLKKIPAMKTIANNCNNDSDIVKMCGTECLDLLRWVILSNRSQLIHLPEPLKLKGVCFPMQFMALIASPRAEEAFQNKKHRNDSKNKKQQTTPTTKSQRKKLKRQEQEESRNKGKALPCYQSLFLWHGSSGARWHSIIRNGLMNMSHKDCVHGAAHGPGIYLAKDVHTSISYTNVVRNTYQNSELGPYMSLIALCEVIPNNMYKDVGSIATLQDEEAIIVRFVFPIVSNRSYIYDDYDGYGDDNEYDGYDARKSGNEPGSRDPEVVMFEDIGRVYADTITYKDIPKIEDVVKYFEKSNKI